MTYPLVPDLAADGIPVAVTCRVLGFSKRGFYAWLARPVTPRDLDDAYLINAAYDIHSDDPEFGYRLIADDLPARGVVAGENRVARLCAQQRIWSVLARKRGLGRRPGPAVHDDLVERQFTATKPNELWLTDITEHRTASYQQSSQHLLEVAALAGRKYSMEQKDLFFRLIDLGGTVHAAAKAAGVHPEAAHTRLCSAGLTIQRATPR